MTPKALEGRVAVVTGSSRGIGRALALRLAREGARVVVTGKSVASTERLPGSIHSVVEAIRALGGEALAVRMDIRREEEVEGMIRKAIQEFGRLDVCCVVEIEREMTFFDCRYSLQKVRKRRERGREKMQGDVRE